MLDSIFLALISINTESNMLNRHRFNFLQFSLSFKTSDHLLIDLTV